MRRRDIVVLWAVAAAMACDSGEAPSGEATPTPEAEPITKKTQVGPVEAVVTLSPPKPALGDPLTLTLNVQAEANVEVELPAFGEALGRFSIMDFVPKRTTTPDGRTEASQRYRLQAPMSGKHKIPSLRIEFVDRRDGQTPDGGTAAVQELLTDEMSVEVSSVLPDGEVPDVLRPARGALPERLGPSPLTRHGPWLAAIVIVVLLGAGIPLFRRYRRARVRVTAYDVAMRRLRALQRDGYPEPDAADEWYVELSAIVRRYLEDRFGLRAPELTTEEFLRDAKRSEALAPEHRELLSSFLEGCDRVKFAAYQPGPAESAEALKNAERFLAETRLTSDETKTEAPAEPPAPAEVGS